MYANAGYWACAPHSPRAQRLRAAQQVVRCLLGGHRGAVHQLQRGELLVVVSCSAEGVCAVFGCCLHISPFRHVDLCRGVNCKSAGANVKNRECIPVAASLGARELEREKTGIAYL